MWLKLSTAHVRRQFEAFTTQTKDFCRNWPRRSQPRRPNPLRIPLPRRLHEEFELVRGALIGCPERRQSLVGPILVLIAIDARAFDRAFFREFLREFLSWRELSEMVEIGR